MASTRFAVPGDEQLILDIIVELARYEHAENEVIATTDMLADWLFQRKVAEVIFALDDEGEEVGMALFFHNFSTWLGRGGIYLEDLYVREKHRGKGYGTLLLKTLARIALDRGCGRLEWSCLDWNQPSIDFYLSLGATPMDDWTMYRVTGDTLKRLAD